MFTSLTFCEWIFPWKSSYQRFYPQKQECHKSSSFKLWMAYESLHLLAVFGASLQAWGRAWWGLVRFYYLSHLSKTLLTHRYFQSDWCTLLSLPQATNFSVAYNSCIYQWIFCRILQIQTNLLCWTLRGCFSGTWELICVVWVSVIWL